MPLMSPGFLVSLAICTWWETLHKCQRTSSTLDIFILQPWEAKAPINMSTHKKLAEQSDTLNILLSFISLVCSRLNTSLQLPHLEKLLQMLLWGDHCYFEASLSAERTDSGNWPNLQTVMVPRTSFSSQPVSCFRTVLQERKISQSRKNTIYYNAFFLLKVLFFQFNMI